MKHWSDKYVGMQWKEGVFDCGDLAVLVQKEAFGKDIALPSDHGRDGPQRSATILAHVADFARPLAGGEAAADGDPVLLVVRGREQHIGTFCLIDGQPWILHSFERIGVHRTRARHLTMFGCKIEGHYKWI